MNTRIVRGFQVVLTLRFVLPLLMSWIFANSDAAAQDFWQQSNEPYGGVVNPLAVNPVTGDIFAGTVFGGSFVLPITAAVGCQTNAG